MKKATEKRKVLTRCSICDGAAKVWREGEPAALRDVRTIDERARWSVCCEDCLQSLVSVVVRGHHSATVHDMEDGSAFIQLIDLD